MDASADIDALMQESKQGIVIIETIFCGVLYIETWGVLSYVLDSVSFWMPQLILMHKRRRGNKTPC